MSFSGDLYPTAGATVVMSTKGDLARYNTERERLGIGSTNQVLAVTAGLPAWKTLTTADSVLTTQGDVLYEGASALARLGFGTSGDVLTTKGTGANPVWETPSSAGQLVKVTKSYTDISSLEIAIYTLPADEALTNVYTDITTVFDVSTAVTIGDSADENGFQESADFTASGLTNATRGAYVTNWKGMRSTSGTTAISAYNFSTTGGSGSTFTQSNTDNSFTLSANTTGVAQLYQASQVLIGEDVCKASFFLTKNVGATGTMNAYIRQSDDTLIATSTTVLDASTISASPTYTEYTFDFPATTMVADYMISVEFTPTAGEIVVQIWDTDIANGLLYLNQFGTWNNFSNKSVTGSITYACVPVTGDTQGAVDFYLQIAKE